MNNPIRKNFSNANILYPNLKKLAKGVSQCSVESAAYTDCCLTKSLNLNQNDCLKEYEILASCVKNKIKKK